MQLSPLERVRTTLATALTLPEEERLAYVRRQCGDDAGVCSELEGLLAIHESAEGFLDTPLPELLGATVPVANELPPGTLLKNRYRVKKLLAASGFATVYLAEDEDIMRRPVVVKVLDQITSDELLRDTFQAEMQSLGQLQHPNIVTLSDRGELANGTPFLVLTYVQGQTLREVLKTGGPLPVYRVQTIVRGVAQALAAAHALSVWHLDIKPENIILTDADTSNERVTVIDFGIARMRELPGSGVRAGSPQYMAPEQGVSPSAQSDIYALAVVTFELLTGRVPERRKPIPSQLPQGLAPWAGVLSQALATDPGQRPESAVAFSKSLRDPERSRRSWRWWWPVAGMGAAASLVLGFFWWSRQGPVDHLQQVPLVTDPGFKQMPAFAPDGSELYYVGGQHDERHIYRKPLHGGTATIVTNKPFKDVFVQVSPEGDRLAIIREMDSGRVLVVKSLRLEQAETEVGRGREFESVSWTADGKHLMTGEGLLDKGTYRMGRVDIGRRLWQPLGEPVSGSLGHHYPFVSPDGKWLGFVREWAQRQTELMRVEISASARCGERRSW
jgi:hypothetical protein